MIALIRAATAQALAMSRGSMRGPHSSSKPMQAQLISKGTVLACGGGDQGATHGSTIKMPNSSV